MIRTLRLCAAIAVMATAAACGGDDAGTAQEIVPAATGEPAPISEVAATSAPRSPTSEADSAEPGSAAFPVTIEHAFGATVIESAPERVVAWGWGSADAVIALGVVPVAIPFQAYGGDEVGVLPWIREALDARGVEDPTVLPNTSEAPMEAIAAAEPDVILAAYSGITQAEYDLLAQIAPTVAYPDKAWSTPWRDLIEIVGAALGKSSEATSLLADIDDKIAAQAAAHPEFDGLTIAAGWDLGDHYDVYKPADPRVEFLLDLGFVSAPSVDELSDDQAAFYFQLSYERLPDLDSDVLLNYADTPELAQAFLDSPHAQLMEQVADGAVASVTGPAFISSVSPPTALSLTWGMEDFVSILADTVANLE